MMNDERYMMTIVLHFELFFFTFCLFLQSFTALKRGNFMISCLQITTEDAQLHYSLT